MTEPDEALLYARDAAVCPWGETDPEFCREVQAGFWDDEGIVKWRAQGYRAGAAASAARIKALEEALWGALPHLEKCFTHHAWHKERPFEPHYITNIRALLKEGDQ